MCRQPKDTYFVVRDAGGRDGTGRQVVYASRVWQPLLHAVSRVDDDLLTCLHHIEVACTALLHCYSDAVSAVHDPSTFALQCVHCLQTL